MLALSTYAQWRGRLTATIRGTGELSRRGSTTFSQADLAAGIVRACRRCDVTVRLAVVEAVELLNSSVSSAVTLTGISQR